MTTSHVQAFNSTLARLIGTPSAPVGGVTSWNGLTGAVKGTLASIYAFGLTDSVTDPNADNFYAMPGFNWRFPGATTGSGRLRGADMLFQQKDQIALSSPPGSRVTSVAFQNNGIGGSGCGNFETYQLVDPLWNQNLNSLSDFISWQLENGTITNDASEGSALVADFLVWNRTLNQKGGSPVTWPVGPDPVATNSTQQRIAMNVNADHLQDVEYLNAYGWHELHLDAIRSGANSQWLTHWRNFNGAPANGDGPAWLIDVDGRFGRFAIAAGLNFYQATADPFGAWGSKLIVRGRSPTTTLVGLDCSTDRTSVLGGIEVENVVGASAPVSDAGTSKIIFDTGSGKFQASINGAAYVDLSTVS